LSDFEKERTQGMATDRWLE